MIQQNDRALFPVYRRKSGAWQALLLLALAGLANPALARCMFAGLEADYARAELVYEATLVLSEYIEDQAPPDPEKQPTPEDVYRFVLRVDRVYKGEPGATVEKRKQVHGIEMISGTPLRLEDQGVGTRLLIFEPGWDSACSQSAVIDTDLQGKILPQLRAWSAQRE
jgi:hypothetical protein